MNGKTKTIYSIFSLRKTLTENFEVNSTNVMESNEGTNIGTDEWKDENYIPLGINAGGITIILESILSQGNNLTFWET